MAITFRNTDGAIGIMDGGTPRVMTVKARCNISGGYWVNGSSAVGVVGSNASTYVASDIEGFTVSTQVGSQVIGLALQDIASGTYGPIARRGDYLLPSASGTKIGSIFAGQTLLAGSAGTVVAYASGTMLPLADVAGIKMFPVARALTNGGAAGEFVAVSLNI